MNKRFKNGPAATEHEFSVVWNQDRTRFDIRRDGMLTSAYSSQQRVAIGLALQAAKQEANESGEKIIVTSLRNGMRIIEWDGVAA